MRPAEIRLWIVLHLGLLGAIASRLGVVVWFLMVVTGITFTVVFAELVASMRSRERR